MKRMTWIASFAALFLALGIFLSQNAPSVKTWLSDASFPYRFGFSKTSNLMIPMRDGARLRSDVYLPSSSSSSVFPTLFVRTTYNGFDFELTKLFVEAGYAVVHQNVRGRFGSEGAYRVHEYSRKDGYDLVNWIVEQPWSNGKVGSYGCSFRGENQIMLAAENHPAHIAMIAEGAGGAIGKAQNSFGYFGVFENGVLNLASALGWFSIHGNTQNVINDPDDTLGFKLSQRYMTAPIVDIAESIIDYETEFKGFLTHPLTSDWWDDQGYIGRGDRFSAATLHVNAWYDQTTQDQILLAKHMAANSINERAKNQYLLLGPGNHCQGAKLPSGEISIGLMEVDYTALDYYGRYLAWFDYWLKGKGELGAKVTHFVTHQNKWVEGEDWPPEGVKNRRFLLDKEGRLLETKQPTEPGAGSFIYDPQNPVPTLGGPICCTGDPTKYVTGAVDQLPLLQRDDVLLFSTEVLPEGMTILGSLDIGLFVSSDALDTDFTLKSVDIYPDGRMFNIQDGVVRMRYRNGPDQMSLIEPDRKYFIELGMRPTAYHLRPGHRLGVIVSSSNFPRLARNLNTGEHEYLGSKIRSAKNTVYWGKGQASYVSVPVE